MNTNFTYEVTEVTVTFHFTPEQRRYLFGTIFKEFFDLIGDVPSYADMNILFEKVEIRLTKDAKFRSSLKQIESIFKKLLSKHELAAKRKT